MISIDKDVSTSAKRLISGGIILYPTDTIWGIGCDATNEQAIEKIYEIKHRSHSKSMIILLKDLASISTYVENPSSLLISELKKAKNPTTAIFSNAKNLPGNLINGNGSVAIRVPDDTFCQALLNEFDKPLVSTSANISSHGSPQNFSQIDPELIRAVDYVVHYRRHDNSLKNPSHIIRLNEHGSVERVR